MRIVGAYQSGHGLLSDEDHVPLSLAVVDACRCITEPKRETLEPAFTNCSYKCSEVQEEHCNFEMIIALSACAGVSIRVSWCKRHCLVGK